jgi:hypothetical protein
VSLGVARGLTSELVRKREKVWGCVVFIASGQVYCRVIRSQRSCLAVVVWMGTLSFKRGTASATLGTVFGVSSDQNDCSLAVGGAKMEVRACGVCNCCLRAVKT